MPTDLDNLLSTIMSNPVGTDYIGQELRNPSPNTQFGGKVLGVPLPANVMGQVQNALPLLMGFGESPGILAGVGSKTAPLEALDWAMDSEAQGVHPDSIWKNTGWGRGADGKWRYEIPDQWAGLGPSTKPSDFDPDIVGVKTAPLDPKQTTPFIRDANGKVTGVNSDFLQGAQSPTLDQVLNHPALFEAYPELAKVPVRPNNLTEALAGYKGSFNPSNNSIAMGSAKPEDFISTLLHETQHAVQHTEGFENGGSPQEFLPAGHDTFVQDLAAKKTEIEQQLAGTGIDVDAAIATKKHEPPGGWTLDGWKNQSQFLDNTGIGPKIQDYIEHEKLVQSSQDKAFKQYQSLAGETEARNVQNRQKLDEYTTRTTPPSVTADVPEEQQILKVHPDVLGDPQAKRALLDHALSGNPYSLEGPSQ